MGISFLIMDADEKFLREHYYRFDSPEAFGTRRKLHQALKRKIKTAKIDVVDSFLKKDKIATLFKRRPKQTAVKRQLQGMTLFSELSADLMDLGSLRKFNSNYAWILVVIDNFSHFLILKKLKQKSKSCMLEAFKDIFSSSPIDIKQGRIPGYRSRVRVGRSSNA